MVVAKTRKGNIPNDNWLRFVIDDDVLDELDEAIEVIPLAAMAADDP